MDNIFGFEIGADAQARKEIRRPLCKSAQLKLEEDAVQDIGTIDISLGGIGILSDAPIAEGTKCEIDMELYFQGRTLKIWLEGISVYSIMKGPQGFRTGIQTTRMNEDGVRYVSAFHA